MHPVSELITNALLAHHHNVCIPHAFRPPVINECLIAYGDLCRDAGVPELVRKVGVFLQETAEWCAENKHPPINSLAVGSTPPPGTNQRQPGVGFPLAPGCTFEDWPELAEAAIRLAAN